MRGTMAKEPATMARRRRYRHYMKEWRLERDMTQKELAEAIGSTKSLVSRYEAHTVALSVDLIFASCQALNIGLEEFFDHPNRAKRSHARLREIKRFHRRMQGELEEE